MAQRQYSSTNYTRAGAEVTGEYESHEFATGGISSVTNITTSLATTAFAKIKPAYRVILRTDETIIVRFNTSNAPAITVTRQDSPFDCNWLEVEAIFLTAARSANVKIILAATAPVV